MGNRQSIGSRQDDDDVLVTAGSSGSVENANAPEALKAFRRCSLSTANASDNPLRTVECTSFVSLKETTDSDDFACSIRPLLGLFRRPPALVNVESFDETTTATAATTAEQSSSSTSVFRFLDGSPFSSSGRSSPNSTGTGSSPASPSPSASSCGGIAALSSSNASASVSSSSLAAEDLMEYTPDEMRMPETPLDVSDLSRPGRPVWIVTTATLPWMTGTAVNPLLRAAALCAPPYSHHVTLVLPWLEESDDRLTLYGPDWEDATLAQQERYLKDWLTGQGLGQAADRLQFDFYPARYHVQLSSIFAMGDLCERIEVPPDVRGDAVCLLEEPEHVNFYRAPCGVTHWRQLFAHVVGIVHTNYKAYAQHHYNSSGVGALVVGPIVGAISAWMVSAYCDRVVKLSNVLQTYSLEKEVVSNVHGIRDEFLAGGPPAGNKVYFLGKLLWAKGLDRLLELQTTYRRRTGQYFDMDVFGSGPEQDEIRKAFLGDTASTVTSTTSNESGGEEESNDDSSSSAYSRYANTWRRRLSSRPQPLPVAFPGRQDHAQLSSDYKILVNPSITEVLCTVTAEAVARGRFVIIPVHPSNEFFYQFPNCLAYKSSEEFVTCLEYALGHDPQPLSAEHRYSLTWRAATERLLDAAAVTERDAARQERLQTRQRDEKLAQWHVTLGRGPRGDTLRKILGGGPVAHQHQYSRCNSACGSSTMASSSGSIVDEEEEEAKV